MDYTDLLTRKFPTDPRLDFYLRSGAPASKLGKALSAYKDIQPGDIVAFHLYGGMFSSGAIVFTATHMHYPDGRVRLEDLQSAQQAGKELQLAANQAGNSVRFSIKTDGEEAAHLLADVLDAIIYEPKADAATEQVEALYAQYDPAQVNWLALRDEVLRTIDALHQRYSDGRLTLLEYEEKKADLLGRL